MDYDGSIKYQNPPHTKRRSIKDVNEKEKLEYSIKTKKWNPSYCLRHNFISSDSDFLPEYALEKSKVKYEFKATG